MYKFMSKAELELIPDLERVILAAGHVGGGGGRSQLEVAVSIGGAGHSHTGVWFSLQKHWSNL